MPGALAEPSPDPDDDLVNDVFRQMVEGLDLDPSVAENMGSITVSSLTDEELRVKFQETKRELYAREELLHPSTDVGKDLQTNYHAYSMEMRKRGLM